VTLTARMKTNENEHLLYYTLRDIVYDALQRGIIVENDAYFLLVEQIGACVSDALARMVSSLAMKRGMVALQPPTAVENMYVQAM